MYFYSQLPEDGAGRTDAELEIDSILKYFISIIIL